MKQTTRYEQSRTAVESTVVVKRCCPICQERTRIEIAEMTDGWEIWRCLSCHCIKHYRVK